LQGKWDQVGENAIKGTSAGRMNRTIKERVQHMFSYAKLLKSFWREAIKIVVDIIKLSPSVPLNGTIPEEIWSRKVSYNHRKVFGCRILVYIPKDQ